MSKYRATVAERVECAKHVQAKVTGVNQTQQRHALPSVEQWVANGGVIERLPSPGDCFIHDQLLSVPYA